MRTAGSLLKNAPEKGAKPAWAAGRAGTCTDVAVGGATIVQMPLTNPPSLLPLHVNAPTTPSAVATEPASPMSHVTVGWAGLVVESMLAVWMGGSSCEMARFVVAEPASPAPRIAMAETDTPVLLPDVP